MDSGGGSVGTKRQRLIERAAGHYVAHVDDDDWVSHDYVKKVLAAIHASDFEADCVTLSGIVTTNGEKPEVFEHSIEHACWYKDATGKNCRTPNHLNAIRREHVLKAGFTDMEHGEDIEFSKRVQPLLVTEAPVRGPLYFYFWKKAVV